MFLVGNLILSSELEGLGYTMAVRPIANHATAVVVRVIVASFQGNSMIGHQEATATVHGGVHDANKCDSLASSQGNFAEKTLVYGCKATINQGYHQNFNLKFAQVQCPKSLFHVTGIRTASDSSLPLASPSLSLPGNSQGTTTMDCCKPTCAWRQNVVGTDSNWPSLYVCSRDGMPLTI